MIARVLCWRKMDSNFSAEILRLAESKIWMLIQKELFPNGWKDLSKTMEVPNNSPIRILSPFMTDNVIKARGRLRKAKLSFTWKHPMLLTGKHPTVKLYLQFMHNTHHHQGVEYLRSVIQKEYRIWALRNSLRAIKYN